MNNKFFRISIFENINKKIVFFGSNHNKDKKQLNKIKEEFEKLKPDIVLVEGNYNIPIYSSEEEAIQKGGEMGYISYLTRKNSIKILSNDPPISKEIYFIKEKYGEDLCFLYFVLRNYSFFRLKLDKKVLDFLIDNFKQHSNWKNFDYSKDNFNKIFFSFFQENFDYSKDYAFYFNPLKNLNKFNTISNELSKFRDDYLVYLIKDLIKKYNKLFIIKGEHHLNKTEERINKIL